MATTLIASAAKSAAGTDSTIARAVDHLPQVRTNVSSAERWVSLAAGGALSVLGFDGRGPSLLSALAGGYLLYRAASGNCPAYQAFGVSTSDTTSPNAVIAAGHGTRVEHAVVVNKPAAEAYRFWRDLENLPRFMNHLVDVDATTDGRSHWVAKGPLGMKVEWDAEIIADIPGEAIGWKSLDGSDVDTAGSVRFRELPGGGTEVRVNLKYDPPAGRVGRAVARLFGEAPEQQIREDLERFKQVIETPPVPTQVVPAHPEMTEAVMGAFGETDWAGIFVPDQSLLASFVRGSAVYLSIIVLFRVAMRRQGGSIGLPDIMLVVLVSECVSTALSAEAKSVPNGLVAVAALLFWSYAFDRLGHRWPWFQRLLEPAPLPLVRDGKPLRENLDSEGITDDELTAQLRLSGVEDVSRVKLATLEADGEVSVIPKDDRRASAATAPPDDDLEGTLDHFKKAAELLRTAVKRHEERAADHKAAARAARELLAKHGVRAAKNASPRPRRP